MHVYCPVMCRVQQYDWTNDRHHHWQPDGCQNDRQLQQVASATSALFFYRLGERSARGQKLNPIPARPREHCTLPQPIPTVSYYLISSVITEHNILMSTTYTSIKHRFWSVSNPRLQSLQSMQEQSCQQSH